MGHLMSGCSSGPLHEVLGQHGTCLWHWQRLGSIGGPWHSLPTGIPCQRTPATGGESWEMFETPEGKKI